MNTPAHLLVGVALFARSDVPRIGWMAALGSLLPDLSLYVLAGVSLFLLQIPPERVFGELYYSTGWQSVFAVDNSLVIWGLLCVLAMAIHSRPLLAFSGAGLAHVLADFAMHHDDARPNFWPITDRVFQSPVSYWDTNHHAAQLAPFILLAVGLSTVVIWRRWQRISVRLAALVACGLEVWVVTQWLLFF